MTPLHFEQTYDEEWIELERMLDDISGRKRRLSASASSIPGARVATLYRRACDHLALARARAYPAYMIDRLERLTSRAHQAIYCPRFPGRRPSSLRLRRGGDGDISRTGDCHRAARLLAI
jgi:hypothetical protein